MAGFRANVYSQIGVSNHVAAPRQDDDFYTTDPAAVEVLVKKLREQLRALRSALLLRDEEFLVLMDLEK